MRAYVCVCVCVCHRDPRKSGPQTGMWHAREPSPSFGGQAWLSSQTETLCGSAVLFFLKVHILGALVIVWDSRLAPKHSFPELARCLSFFVNPKTNTPGDQATRSVSPAHKRESKKKRTLKKTLLSASKKTETHHKNPEKINSKCANSQERAGWNRGNPFLGITSRSLTCLVKNLT